MWHAGPHLARSCSPWGKTPRPGATSRACGRADRPRLPSIGSGIAVQPVPLEHGVVDAEDPRGYQRQDDGRRPGEGAGDARSPGGEAPARPGPRLPEAPRPVHLAALDPPGRRPADRPEPEDPRGPAR